MKLKRLNRMMANTLLVATTLVVTMVVTALPAQAGYVAVYAEDSTLQNFAKPWMVLAIEGSDPNGGNAREYSDNGYSEWQIVDHAPNGHTIQEFYRPNRCLDSNHAGALYGIPCNGGGYQRWDFIHVGVKRDSFYQRNWDAYEIRNRATGLCLDANGQVGYTLACNGGDYQRWFLIDIDNNGRPGEGHL